MRKRKVMRSRGRAQRGRADPLYSDRIGGTTRVCCRLFAQQPKDENAVLPVVYVSSLANAVRRK